MTLGLQLFKTPLDFTSVTVESIEAQTEQIVKLYQDIYKSIASLKLHPEKMSFATVIQPLIDLQIYSANAHALCSFPRRVFTDKAIRDKSNQALEILDKIDIQGKSDAEVYAIFQLYFEMIFPNEKHLDQEDKRYVEKLNLYYKRNGMHIQDQKTKDEVKKIKEQIAELAIQFESNLDNESTILMMRPQELQGLPNTWFEADREVTTEKFKVTLKYPDVVPILEYATDRMVRKRIYTAFNSRCADKNLDLLDKIVTLRRKHAALLGYETHADYAIEPRMAKTRHHVKDFLDEMNKRFSKALENNLKDLTEFARKYEKDPHFKLEVYDLRYYMRLHSEETYQIDMESIKEFFPEPRVIAGTLAIYEKVLGLRFVESTSKNKWHEDVRLYEVYNYNHSSNAQGEKIGQFYLDLHPRDGKYGHAAIFDIVPGCDISHITGTAEDRVLPQVAMVCNFPKKEGIPFDDVVTFFHEFGHLVHAICSRTKLAEFFAFKVELDFVEAPSQMLENWCYDEQVLKILSEHPTTKQSLPPEVAAKIRGMDKLHAGYINKRQLVLAYLDYAIHTLSEQDLERLDIKNLYQQIHEAIIGIPAVAEDCFPATFGHLVGEYDAGYYGYMMSATYAADMFDTVFKKDPLSMAAGAHYRKTILAPGASVDGMDLIIAFLGRKPNLAPFLEHNGLPAETSV